ncbi:MAG: hypothetical protein CMO80_03815 [Verrucomicrobiales bacterium]|nr:hypothetical protein [Verrucomicrobiales bacterium]
MPSAATDNPETILVVDDNPITRISLGEVFRERNYNVIEAGDATECRQALEENVPDLLLLDVQLGDVNGMDLCREFRADERLATLFICLISSSVIESDRQVEGFNVGADSYIVRPISDDELLARIEALFRIQRAENALRDSNEALEQKVADRTADLARANLRLQGLHSIDQAILHSLSAKKAAEAARTHVGNLLPASLVEVWALEGRGDGFIRLAGKDARQKNREFDPPLFELLDRIADGEIFQSTNSKNPFGGETIWASLIAFPLSASGQILGVLLLASTRDEGLQDDELRIGTEVARSLAVTLNLANLFVEVNDERERTRTLSRRVLDIQEEERRFLSRELHDEIGQHLTGMKAMIQSNINSLPEENTGGLKKIVKLVNDLMGQVRQLSINLRPQMLDKLGLVKALEWHFNRVWEQSQIRIAFSHNEFDRLPPHIEIAIFRIAQEALTNVARYAEVEKATVRLFVDDDRCRLQIEDAGEGFDAAAKLEAMQTSGLSGMRERASLLGGELIIESELGNGTCLTADLPITIAEGTQAP